MFHRPRAWVETGCLLVRFAFAWHCLGLRRGVRPSACSRLLRKASDRKGEHNNLTIVPATMRADCKGDVWRYSDSTIWNLPFRAVNAILAAVALQRLDKAHPRALRDKILS